MSIEIGIWRMDKEAKRIPSTKLDDEDELQALIFHDPSLISDDLLILGQHVRTAYGKEIDLLGINSEGELVVIELKRDKTPRDVVAQTIDYASWIGQLSYQDIVEIFNKYNPPGDSFEHAFEDAFKHAPMENLNETHLLVVVASELDDSTERIVDYLGESFGVPINVVFFSCFEDGGNKYLTRTWFKDPKEVEASFATSNTKTKKEAWNNRDFYVNFQEGESRNWEDARKYGFVSAGGGTWYRKTLFNLFVGARIFVNHPGLGYIGVGIVKDGAKPVKDFFVTLNGKEIPILEAHLNGKIGKQADDPELTEYLVKVEWIKTVPLKSAYWETGFFATQHTVSKLRNKFTLDKLTAHFELEE
jgi:hypothetical protein